MFDRSDLIVACIAAHPDDEVLMAGASLARHAAAGQAVRILILGTGLEARGAADTGALTKLAGEARAAAGVLGAAEPEMAGLPDNKLDTLPLLDLVQRIETYIERIAPSVIYTHHCSDLNVDHRLTHDAVVTACRPLPGRSVPRILAGEVLSSTEWQSPQRTAFQPTVFHDVEATLEAKLAAMRAYAGELRDPPHPRSLDGIRAQAQLRGMQAGCRAAESFMLVRERA